MKIQVLFFGITTDLVGKTSIPLTISEITTVYELKEILKLNYPNLKNIHDFSIAVNETYADNDLVLTEENVVAIIPPVSGG